MWGAQPHFGGLRVLWGHREAPGAPPGEVLARAVPSRSRAGRRAGLCLASSRAPLLIGACAGQVITVLAAEFPPRGFRLSHPETRAKAVASGPIQPGCGAIGGTPCPPSAPRHRPWLRLSARVGSVPISEVTKLTLNELLATNTELKAGRWLSKFVYQIGVRVKPSLGTSAGSWRARLEPGISTRGSKRKIHSEGICSRLPTC